MYLRWPLLPVLLWKLQDFASGGVCRPALSFLSLKPKSLNTLVGSEQQIREPESYGLRCKVKEQRSQHLKKSMYLYSGPQMASCFVTLCLTISCSYHSRRSRGFKVDDRLFSLSSITSPAVSILDLRIMLSSSFPCRFPVFTPYRSCITACFLQAVPRSLNIIRSHRTSSSLDLPNLVTIGMYWNNISLLECSCCGILLQTRVPDRCHF